MRELAHLCKRHNMEQSERMFIRLTNSDCHCLVTPREVVITSYWWKLFYPEMINIFISTTTPQANMAVHRCWDLQLCNVVLSGHSFLTVWLVICLHLNSNEIGCVWTWTIKPWNRQTTFALTKCASTVYFTRALQISTSAPVGHEEEVWGVKSIVVVTG